MADFSSCVFVGYPDPAEVAEEHRNWIILANYFKLKPGCKDKTKVEDRVVLKVFPAFIYSLDRQMFLDLKLKQVLHVMPYEYYHVEQFDYDNSDQFYRNSSVPEDWLESVPVDKQILVYYTKVQSVGCEHYIRGCYFWCEKCYAFYSCRLCHDAEIDNHKFDRYTVEKVKCRYCALEQPFQQICDGCHRSFGWYICKVCKMICGMGQDAKPNYHCDGCQMCMVGRRNLSKHCYACNSCFATCYFDKHNCQKVQGECIVCMEDMVNTIYGRIIADCGHAMHTHCYQLLINQGNYRCPVCKRFLPREDDKKRIVEWLLGCYKLYFVPRQYANYYAKCKCNDCMTEFPQLFSLYKQFCSKCENFNVEVIGDSSFEEYQEYMTTHKEWLEQMLPTKENCQRYLQLKFGAEYEETAKLPEGLYNSAEFVGNEIARILSLNLDDKTDQDILVALANHHTAESLEQAEQIVRVLRDTGAGQDQQQVV